MRVLGACSLGGAGHLEPLRPLLDAAQRRGADTLVAGPPAIASMVEQMGFRVAVCGEPPEDVVGPIRERLPTAPAAEASVLGNRELFGRLATAAMLPGLERIVAGWGPDLVVRDPCEYASAVIGHREHIAMAQVAIGLADVEWGSIEVASAALEVHRSGLTDEVRLTPYVTRFPASLDSSPFPDTRRYRETPGHPMPLPDWWDGSTAPLLYVSFGTVLGHMSMAATAYRVALAAVGELDARVLLTVGRRFDLDQLDAIPHNVHVEPWVNQPDVLAEADVVVCHGGSGTTFGALAAGVPLVIAPMFADQFANGAKVAASGAGVTLGSGAAGGRRRPLSWADGSPLAQAIETVRRDRSYRLAAHQIATEMASAPTIDELLMDLLAQ
ncbi:MAG TPA: glycosyltransferase [Acidimicrobiaceae bacterium]|nr:glycosyltransferase [Acidimicrobiaceae bacterium]